jgi:PTS system mannose-specific IIB component
MPIQLARIDDRLVHGQVTVGWTRLLSINRILVINDRVAKDPIQQAVLEMAAPAGIKVTPVTVADAIERLTKTEIIAKTTLMLIFTNPMDVLAIVQAGVSIPYVNVGGMQFKPGKTQISKAVSVDANDIAAFRELHGKGLALTVQMMPGDKPAELWPQLERL